MLDSLPLPVFFFARHEKVPAFYAGTFRGMTFFMSRQAECFIFLVVQSMVKLIQDKREF